MRRKLLNPPPVPQDSDGVLVYMNRQRNRDATARIAWRILELAAALNVSRSHIDRAIKSGEIVAVKIGSLTVVPAYEVERILAGSKESKGVDA